MSHACMCAWGAGRRAYITELASPVRYTYMRTCVCMYVRMYVRACVSVKLRNVAASRLRA